MRGQDWTPVTCRGKSGSSTGGRAPLSSQGQAGTGNSNLVSSTLRLRGDLRSQVRARAACSSADAARVEVPRHTKGGGACDPSATQASRLSSPECWLASCCLGGRTLCSPESPTIPAGPPQVLTQTPQETGLCPHPARRAASPNFRAASRRDCRQQHCQTCSEAVRAELAQRPHAPCSGPALRPSHLPPPRAHSHAVRTCTQTVASEADKSRMHHGPVPLRTAACLSS